LKSNTTQLANRGFINNNIEHNYNNLLFNQKVDLLNSKLATDRTLGARLLSINREISAVDILINALKKEKKLYTKIEICNSLVTFGQHAVVPLINQLGKIGNNQYKQIPTQPFKKINYPLPRDIAARTLMRIGEKALPHLLPVLKSKNTLQLSEAIDVVGYICFYNYQPSVFNYIEECFMCNKQNPLIQWKLIRAMSAFPESKEFLKNLLATNTLLTTEINRSILLIERNI